MKTVEVKVAQDHVESLARVRNPIIALEELVWNGLDADASRIQIKVVTNDMGGLAKIKISDNGTGISFSECSSTFGSLGGSAKSKMELTPGGRVPHGKNGKGRFRAFGIGPVVTWTSKYESDGVIRKFDITGRRSRLKRFEIGDEKDLSRGSTGVEVVISEIETNYPSLMDAERAAEELSRRLALYLRKYPGIAIDYDGFRVDPSRLEERSDSYQIKVHDKDGNEQEAELTIIEWKTPTDRALYFCDNDGFTLEECPPGIQAPGFHFTSYVKSEMIPELVDDGAFAFEELHPQVASIADAAKEKLREHFRKREAQRSKDLVKKWKDEKVYPYKSAERDPIKKVEKQVFDVCAVKIHEYMPSFEKSDQKNKKLTFRLIREALENNPDSLQQILQQVLDLPEEQQNNLAAILGRTHLAAVINATRTVIDRLDFIASLDVLLFGDFKTTLLERKQLHRILAEELWIFGDQYMLGVDDESLASVLKKHVGLLERDSLSPTDDEEINTSNVFDLAGKQRIVDLMLYRQIPQLQPDNFEHLVIELKRPSCKLGQKEIGQIENYAFSIAEDERFDQERTKWTFVLLGNEFTSFAENKCRVQGRKFGHIHASEDGAVNIFVKKWSSVIAEAKWRYQFFKEKLELEVKTADGIEYLKQQHSDKIPVRSAAKRKKA